MSSKTVVAVPAADVKTEATVRLLSDAVRASGVDSGAGEHIVLLIDQFPHVLGGGERVVLRTARLLVEAGYRVSIITFQVLCAPEVLQAAQCPVYLLPLHSVFSLAALRGAWQLGRYVRATRAGVVMTFFESSNLFGGVAVKLLSRARLIWNRRDMGILREPKHRAAYRWMPFLPDHVIAVSDEVRRHAVEVDRIAPEHVSVVYNGVPLTLADSTREWPESPVVVTVGNLRTVKGQDILVEAAGAVVERHPGTQFLIAGEPLEAEYFTGLQQRVKALGLGDRIRFLGGVADPAALLQTASVFVLPSRSEGFSNAIVEAMAAGLPVIATTVGGNAEAVEDGRTGLLVPPEDPAALSAALVSLLENTERSRAMGAAGRQRAAQMFSEAAMLRGLTEAFAKARR